MFRNRAKTLKELIDALPRLASPQDRVEVWLRKNEHSPMPMPNPFEIAAYIERMARLVSYLEPINNRESYDDEQKLEFFILLKCFEADLNHTHSERKEARKDDKGYTETPELEARYEGIKQSFAQFLAKYTAISSSTANLSPTDELTH